MNGRFSRFIRCIAAVAIFTACFAAAKSSSPSKPPTTTKKKSDMAWVISEVDTNSITINSADKSETKNV